MPTSQIAVYLKYREEEQTSKSTLLYELLVYKYIYQGPVVQNLTKSLANVKLKFSSWNYGKCIDVNCWKNVSSFCIAKTTHNFVAKTSMYLKVP